MKSIISKLYHWLHEDKQLKIASSKELKVLSREGLDSEPMMFFKVYNAIGGKIVEFRYHDRKSDRTYHQTYIITNDQDFALELGKVATLEVMKQ